MKRSLSLIILATYSLIATCFSVPSPLTTLQAITKRDDTDPVDRFPDGAKLIVNGFEWMIPLQVSRQVTLPLTPEVDVFQAKVRRAPVTFHCFFSSPQNELPSASFDFIRDLAEPYLGATSITCQTLSKNQQFRTHVVWVRYADDGMDVNGDKKTEELLNLYARKNVSKMTFRGKMNDSIDRVGEAREIVAAALMVQPRGRHQCALINTDEKDDAVRTFTAYRPISGFVMSARGISCYPSGEGDDIGNSYNPGEIW